MANLKIGCVILAAGKAERFGKNKLLANFNGKPLIDYALDVIPKNIFFNTVLVSRFASFEEKAVSHGFNYVHNPAPSNGQSFSIKLGINAMPSADAVLFLTADQPLLTTTSICNIVEMYKKNVNEVQLLHQAFEVSAPDTSSAAPKDGVLNPLRGNEIIALAHNGRRGNPCLFPKRFFTSLLNLQNDEGGRKVINANLESLLLCNAQNPNELIDVDTKNQLYNLMATDTEK